MKYITFLYVVLMIVVVKVEQICSLQVETMDTFRTRIDVDDTRSSYFSSGILKSHLGSFMKSNTNKTLIISAPAGYGILAAIRLLDLRPNRQDSLTLFADGIKGMMVRYTNIFSVRNRWFNAREDQKLFYAPNGQLGVTFTTGSSYFNLGYDGFQLIYTVQANLTKCNYGDFHCDNGKCIAYLLKCDGHNHCGDRSDQFNCYEVVTSSPGRTVGIVSGVIFLLIAAICLVVILSRRGRTRTETRISHPPPTNLPSYPPSYPQPGTCYPPPPPPYSQYNQGITNPTYH